MSAPSPAEIAALAARLGSSVAADRLTAAETLCRAGEAARPAAVSLVRGCDDVDSQVRDWCVAALEELGPPPETAVPDLTALLASGPLAAYWAATLLGRAGQAAGSAAVALGESLAAGIDPAVRQRAAWALGKLGPTATAARGPLAAAANDPDERLARLAAAALAALGDG